MHAGLRSLMVASTSAEVTALTARARANRVAAGHVEADGVSLHDGNLAGRADWIVTRDNRRTMTCNRGRDWDRNGDAWTITHRHDDGSLKIRHLGHDGVTHQILPVDEDARLDRTIYDRHARAAREILETVIAAEGA